MCNIRGFRHRCSHTVYRYISTCRATFCDPNSPTTPRCLPSASYILEMATDCMDCQFEAFCRTWQKRIRAAEQRRDVFATQLSPRKSRKDTWASSVQNDSEWSSWGEWPSGAEDATVLDESCYWEDVEDSSDTDDDGLNAIERSMLIKERDKADQEATRLQNEFDRQKWELWQKYLGGSDVATLRKRANYWGKRRRTSPKINGGSPLNRVQNASDLPDPETPIAEVLLFGLEELSGDESDASDCSSTPALSRSSTISDDLSSSDDEEIEGLSEEAEIEGLKEFKRILEISEKRKAAHSSFESAPTVGDDGDNEMLPVWLECF